MLERGRCNARKCLNEKILPEVLTGGTTVEGMTEDPLTECCDYGGGEHTKESTKSAPTLKYYKRMKIFSD